MRSVGFNCFSRSCFCPLIGKPLCKRSQCDTCGQSLDINREVDPRQRLVKIIDVEKNVFFWGGKSKVHQMAIAAGLDRKPSGDIFGQILRDILGGAGGQVPQRPWGQSPHNRYFGAQKR